MKNISRENYEIWFIDYIDGKLDESSKQELLTFLAANTDLAEELRSFESLKLKPEQVSFSMKGKLEKEEGERMDIDAVDYLLIKQMEEGLGAHEEEDLTAAIRREESLIKRGEMFQKTRLFSEPVPFPQKASLIHRETGNLLSIGVKVASAAAVIIAAVWGFQNFWPQKPAHSMAGLTPLKSNTIHLEQPTVKGSRLIINPGEEPDKKIEMKGDKYFVNNEIENQEKKQLPQTEESVSSTEWTMLASRTSVSVSLPVQMPSAYETGLRHMMPQYLDLHNRQERLMAALQQKGPHKNDNSFLVKGLKFVDKVSGDLVNFERFYDDEGNYVAYNLKAGNIEMKQKIKN